MNIVAERNHADTLFTELFKRAEDTNRLYFVLTLLNGWGPVGPMAQRRHVDSIDFIVEVNRATTELLVNPAAQGRAIEPHVALFILQLNYEAKAFYAAVRNLAMICIDELVTPEPWRVEEIGSYGVLSTSKIITNLGSELAKADFPVLAGKFIDLHKGNARRIRNAVAHATFRTPADQTGHKWLFGDYTRDHSGRLCLVTVPMDHEEFSSVVASFIAFRLGFFAAITRLQEKYRAGTFEFRATNQNDRTQLLKCRCERGALTVQYQGIPLW